MNLDEYKAHIAKGSQKTSKYKSVITEVDGIKFDSKKEAEYYGFLKIRVKAKELLDFKRQVRYKLEVNGILITTYVADFVEIRPDQTQRVVDVKSEFTELLPMYRIKKKLMKAIHGITIEEV